MNLVELLVILVAVSGSGWYLSCELCALSHQNAHVELLLRQQTSINDMTTDILTEFLNASAANTTAALLELTYWRSLRLIWAPLYLKSETT
jgi:hypothetical protein